MGAFFAAKPQKTGLSAPIPRTAYGATAGFPLQSLSRKKLYPGKRQNVKDKKSHTNC
jgi:hypothetical protein